MQRNYLFDKLKLFDLTEIHSLKYLRSTTDMGLDIQGHPFTRQD